jgi:hypothetical protein
MHYDKSINTNIREVLGGWENYLTRKFIFLYSSPVVIKETKEMRMSLADQQAHKEKVRYTCRILVENLKGRNHLGKYA